MAGNEVGDNLLSQPFLTADTVELSFEVIELLEGRFAHEVQHVVAGVLGSHLQTSADMAGDEFTSIFLSGTVSMLVLAVIKEQVVAHAAADETLLYFWQGIDSMVDIQQFRMVGVQVRTNLRMDTTGAFALLTNIDVAAMHAVHVG